jgi:hypothetical protein
VPTLTEFLKEEATRLRNEAPKRQATISSWRSAVERLFEQIKEWLKEADSEKVLEIREEPVQVAEQDLGAYVMPSLNIELDASRIVFYPRARRVVARIVPPGEKSERKAEGMVEIHDGGVVTTRIYYLSDNGADRWIYQRSIDFGTEIFDRRFFEGLLISLLK